MAAVENLPRFQFNIHDNLQAFSRWVRRTRSVSLQICSQSLSTIKWLTTSTPVVLDTPYAGTSGRVIVPSRCYFRPSKERPLDGARITVKDNIDIAGHKTSLCNRAWLELYPEKTKTAACVQVLIDAGAIILGKVKLQAMIMREEPLECVEFIALFNP